MLEKSELLKNEYKKKMNFLTIRMENLSPSPDPMGPSPLEIPPLQS